MACRAGLGWIGKNNLLTTPDFGGAVRLCTVVTDARLPTAEPILQPLRRRRVCVDACPSSALYGTLWHTGWTGTICSTTCCANAPPRAIGTLFWYPIAICGKCFAVSLHPAISEKRMKKVSGRLSRPEIFFFMDGLVPAAAYACRSMRRWYTSHRSSLIS